MTHPFEAIVVGTIVTRFGEAAKRVAHLTYDDRAPYWFHPTRNKAQGCIHRDGFSFYFEVDLDNEARENAHPFTNDVAPHAKHIEQLSLL